MVHEARVEPPVSLQAQFAEFQMLQQCLHGASAADLKAFHAFQQAALSPAVETSASHGASSYQFGGGGGFPHSNGGLELRGARNPPAYYRCGGHHHHNGGG